MAYPYRYYRQRLAKGEEIAGKDLRDEIDDNEMQAQRAVRIVYTVVGIIMLLVLTRIILRLSGLEDTAISSIVHGLTDPYVWIFNSLFSSSPQLFLISLEPGSLVSLVFFPLLSWAIRGLIFEISRGKYYLASVIKVRR